MNNIKISHKIKKQVSTLFCAFSIFLTAVLIFIKTQPVSATNKISNDAPPTAANCAKILSNPDEAIDNKITERTELLNSNPPLLVRDDGGEPTNLITAIRRLANKEILALLSARFRNNLEKTIVESYHKLYAANIMAEYEVAKKARAAINKAQTALNNEPEAQDTSTDYTQKDKDGLYLSSFIQAHRERLREAIKTRPSDPNDRMSKQESWAVELLKKDKPTLQNGETPAKFITTQLSKLNTEIIDNYDSGVDREPNFTAFIIGLGDISTELVVQLKKAYSLNTNAALANKENEPILLKETQHQILLDIENYFDQLITKDTDGNFNIAMPTKRIVGKFSKEIATLQITPDQKQISEILKSAGVAFNCTFFHGAGTNRSNVASWINLLSLLLQTGCLPTAFDMPGSLGKIGLALNSIRTAEEMAIYINKIGEYAQNKIYTNTNEHGLLSAQLPVIQVGRSSGATQVFATAFMLNEMQKKPVTDLNFLISFSNPFTMDDQTANVYDQVHAGIIKGVVEDSLTAADNLGHDLIKKLKKHHPDSLRLFGDDILFAQGDHDLDGSPRDKNSPDVVTQLTQFRDEYSPLGHIYVFSDPLKSYAENGLLKHIDAAELEAITEASHYLLSNFDNITDARRGALPSNIPESDLPKLRDQFYEVFALKYAMLDYMIDLSPITSQEKRDRLKQQRLALTGSAENYGYLRWYTNNIINKPNASDKSQNWSFDSVISDTNILPTRLFGIRGRLKKVYNFIHEEADRIKLMTR